MIPAILINDTSNESHLGSKAVINNIKRLCIKNNINLISTFTRKDIINWYIRLEEKIKQCELIIINGEGSLHHSPPFFDILVARKDKFKEKKLVLINSIWQCMNNIESEKYFKKFSFISFRESLSLQDFKKKCPLITNVHIIPDIIFATDLKYKHIGFGDSVIEKYRIEFQKTNNYFPMNYINNYPDVYSYINWLKTLKLYVTGRYHGCCLSIMAETPFLAMKSNSHKIQGLLKDMDCKELLIDSLDEIEQKKEIAFKAIPKIIKYKEESVHKIEQMFKTIGQL